MAAAAPTQRPREEEEAGARARTKATARSESLRTGSRGSGVASPCGGGLLHEEPRRTA